MDTQEHERLEFSRPTDLPGTEVLLVEHSSRHWRWVHETYSICTVTRGTGSIQWNYRGKVHEATPGEIVLYEPGEVHCNRNILFDATFRVLFIPAQVMEDAAAECGAAGRPHWKLTHTGHPMLHAACGRCITA